MNIQHMKYNIAIKENAIMKSVGKWMDLENTILSDKDKCHIIFSHLWFLDPNSQTSGNSKGTKFGRNKGLKEQDTGDIKGETEA